MTLDAVFYEKLYKLQSEIEATIPPDVIKVIPGNWINYVPDDDPRLLEIRKHLERFTEENSDLPGVVKYDARTDKFKMRHDRVDEDKIKNVIKEHGYKTRNLADAMQISSKYLLKKLSGKVDMTIDDLRYIAYLLDEDPRNFIICSKEERKKLKFKGLSKEEKEHLGGRLNKGVR